MAIKKKLVIFYQTGYCDCYRAYVLFQSVSVECDYGYDLSGTNPRLCEEAGWKTAAQTCVKNGNWQLALKWQPYGCPFLDGLYPQMVHI